MRPRIGYRPERIYIQNRNSVRVLLPIYECVNKVR